GLGASWVVSRENFLADNSVINYLKFRGSYGELGNNKIIRDGAESYFPYQTLFSAGNNQLGQTGVILDAPSNYDLTWEASVSSTVGVDFGLFKNRITGNVDYFKRESK